MCCRHYHTYCLTLVIVDMFNTYTPLRGQLKSKRDKENFGGTTTDPCHTVLVTSDPLKRPHTTYFSLDIWILINWPVQSVGGGGVDLSAGLKTWTGRVSNRSHTVSLTSLAPSSWLSWIAEFSYARCDAAPPVVPSLLKGCPWKTPPTHPPPPVFTPSKPKRLLFLPLTCIWSVQLLSTYTHGGLWFPAFW